MAAVISLKLALFNNTIRRVGVSAEVTLSDLWVVVQKLFLPVQVSPKTHSLQYTDEDGDNVLLSTEEELKEALRQAKLVLSAKFQVSLIVKKQIASYYHPKPADAGQPWPTQVREKPVAIEKNRFKQNARLLESHLSQQQALARRNRGNQPGVQSAYITLTEALRCPTAAPPAPQAPQQPQAAAAVATTPTAPVPQPPALFIESLKALEAMGFVDQRRNIETLIVSRGSLNGAVALLLQQK